jgi:uncharacterized protein
MRKSEGGITNRSFSTLASVAVLSSGSAQAAEPAASPVGLGPHIAVAEVPAPFPKELLPDFLNRCSVPEKLNVEVERRSFLVPSYDGTRIAVDVFLPKGLAPGAKVPTIYTTTRYHRSQKGDQIDAVDQRWVAQGYARVIADSRGTGASFGQWYMPWMPPEVQDIGFIANWIARQPWSNGNVAATGLSYPGSTSQRSPAFGMPAIKVIVPRSVVLDEYTELLAPGGIPQESLWASWGKGARRLDLNMPFDIPPPPGAPSFTGVRPVDGPSGETLLADAIKEHELNPGSFDEAAYQMTFKDQPLTQFGGWPVETLSTYTYSSQIQASKVPMLIQASWLDAGTAQGAVNRFMSWSNPQLVIIGAWNHASRADANQFDPAGAALNFPLQDQENLWFCFMNEYVNKVNSAPPPHEIIYYTMVENAWKQTQVWPLSGTREQRFYLDTGNILSTRPPQAKGLDSYAVDFAATTGPGNRWSTQAGPAPAYGNRAEADGKLLTYTSARLVKDVEVTGTGQVSLNVKSSSNDGNFFVYLEDVAPDGRVTYVTEGELRALHRKLSDEAQPYETTYSYRSFRMRDAELLTPGKVVNLTFPLLTTSILFKADHRIRISIGGADSGNFLRIPAAAQGPVTIGVERGGTSGSFVDLPIVPR